MGNGLPGQPFDHFKLIDNTPATPITYGRYKTYSGPGGTGTVLRDQVVVDASAPAVPLPKATLAAGGDFVLDDLLNLPGVESLVVDVQPLGWPIHTTSIQYGAGDELKYVEVRLAGISQTSFLYLVQIYLVRYDAQGVEQPEIHYPKWI